MRSESRQTQPGRYLLTHTLFACLLTHCSLLTLFSAYWRSALLATYSLFATCTLLCLLLTLFATHSLFATCTLLWSLLAHCSGRYLYSVRNSHSALFATCSHSALFATCSHSVLFATYSHSALFATYSHPVRYSHSALFATCTLFAVYSHSVRYLLTLSLLCVHREKEKGAGSIVSSVAYTHLRAHET